MLRPVKEEIKASMAYFICKGFSGVTEEYPNAQWKDGDFGVLTIHNDYQ